MSDLSAIFDSSLFNSKLYINEITTKKPGVEILLLEKQKVQTLADETNAQLKKNVYKNYTQFIETAKEISYLEGEMLQLSHLLTEQQGALNSLLEISITSDDSKNTVDSVSTTPEDDEDNQKTLSSILEKVEGYSPLLDSSTRYVVHSGKLFEVNGVDMTPMNNVFVALLNDSLLIATYQSNRKGPLSYKFQDLYELDALAVVNVKSDSSRMKNCFKLLMFPVTRFFQCDSAKSKNEWLKKIDMAKKNKEYSSITLLSRSSISIPSSRPTSFQDEEEEEEEDDENFPEWILELPDDLDVLIAQRDFEGAVTSIKNAEAFFMKNSNQNLGMHLNQRIEQRKKQLVEILTNELKVSPDQAIQGGPRSARRAVNFLISLEKSSLACELFLKHQQAVLKHSLRQQQMEGATFQYIRRLSNVFFNNLFEAAKEFNKAFKGRPFCASSLVLWCQTQLEEFAQTFVKHVFTAQSTLGIAADCVQCIRTYCVQLQECGLDLTHTLDKLLHSGVERVITESRDKLLEAIKVRAAEDKWRPQNLQNEVALKKFTDEMTEIGINNISSFVFDECFISLTANTISFTKIFLHFLEDLQKITMPYLYPLIVDSLTTVFKAQINYFESCYNSDKYKAEEKFIIWNATFLFDTVLPLAEKLFAQSTGRKCSTLAELHGQANVFRSGGFFGSTTITKYSSTAFL